MSAAAIPTTTARPGFVARLFPWGRVRSVLLISGVLGLVLGMANAKMGILFVMARVVVLGLCLMTVFGVFEQWPRKLPRWIERWVLQVVAVAVSIPPLSAIIHAISTPDGAKPFYAEGPPLHAFGSVTVVAMLLGPWFALGAIVRQREAMARTQALAFELERSELERRALDARLRVLQGQVTPHFLFNTLANVQALVEAGSPQAPAVLRSLIAYLRAAVPHFEEPTSTLGREVELVRAYLDLMHMRIPDRLVYTVDLDDAARTLRCPPMTLLTLVENAVRHGIDPSEEGGRIDVHAQRRGNRVIVRVSDTGVGLRAEGNGGLGTGLATLRERLRLTFGDDARLRVSAQQPRGVCAELDLPAREETA